MVQWLRLHPNTQGAGSIPVQGAKIPPTCLIAKNEKHKTNSIKTFKMVQKIFKKRISIFQYGMGHPYTAIALLFFFLALSSNIIFPSSFIEI